MLVKKFTRVEKTQRDDFVWTVVFFLTGGSIWAILWLYCLPHTWTLLPWGSWDTNWWKIFPFIGLFGVGTGAGGVVLIPIIEKFRNLATAEKKAVDFEDDFKAKLADVSVEENKFELPELKSLDPTKEPLAKEKDEEAKVIQTEFTSILGDMSIHEKYKK